MTAPPSVQVSTFWQRRFARGLVAVTLLAAFLALAAVGVLGAMVAQDQLAEARAAKAAAVAHAVQRDLGRALGHGIPLDRIEGLAAYLDGIAARNPDLDVLEIATANGRMLHAAGSHQGSRDGLRAVRLPLRAGEAVAGQVVVGVIPVRIRAQIAGELEGIALGMAAVLLLLAEVAAALAQVAFQVPLGRLACAMDQAVAGAFGTLIGHRPGGHIGRALLAFNAVLFELHERRQRFVAHADEVRGAVFDPAIAEEVERTRDRTLAALGEGMATALQRTVQPHPAEPRAYAALVSAAAVVGVAGALPSTVPAWAAAGAAVVVALAGMLAAGAVAGPWRRAAAMGAALLVAAGALLQAWPGLVLCAGAGGLGAALAWRYARTAGSAVGVARALVVGGAAAVLWRLAPAGGGGAEAVVPALLAILSARPLVQRS